VLSPVLAKDSQTAGLSSSTAVGSRNALPVRNIGKHKISRLIIGGNPFSYIAHSEPLVYSRDLFQHYFTHEKVVETLGLGQQFGINTFLGRIDSNVIGFLELYEKTHQKSIPWLAQTSAKPHRGATTKEIIANIKLAADHGATGIYFHGESADYLVQNGRTDEIKGYVDYIRELGLVAGIGAHEVETIEACEARNFQPDFYMKTFNSLEYCCPNFRRTGEVMASVEIPWIAFKVLAAGRIEPEEGFAMALDAGADFLCVGMFDFQVEEDVGIARSLFLDE
jgi:hypothetical protein